MLKSEYSSAHKFVTKVLTYGAKIALQKMKGTCDQKGWGSSAHKFVTKVKGLTYYAKIALQKMKGTCDQKGWGTFYFQCSAFYI